MVNHAALVQYLENMVTKELTRLLVAPTNTDIKQYSQTLLWLIGAIGHLRKVKEGNEKLLVEIHTMCDKMALDILKKENEHKNN